ncbi:hypothetical protein J7438_13770 [Thalassotalea sp. G20_0]|uniref:hypothetical protein n=1 Tax=Thalassotalea sp. G20_0 TaxID=2821093 RepID=UPI001ADB7B56|nr:hypothetical protein [Thalassotalea sp. G20_0]MBO9495147.1 hypothetical protein [Thalassotalea sp. G20_0]
MNVSLVSSSVPGLCGQGCDGVCNEFVNMVITPAENNMFQLCNSGSWSENGHRSTDCEKLRLKFLTLRRVAGLFDEGEIFDQLIETGRIKKPEG